VFTVFTIAWPWLLPYPASFLHAFEQALQKADWSQVETLSQYLRARPERPVQSQGYAGLAAIALAQGDYDQALAQATLAATHDPENVYSHVIRGDVQLAKRHREGAIEAYKTALEKSRGQPWQQAIAAHRLGCIYDKRANVGLARKYYDEAIRQNPDDAKVYAHRASLLEEIREVDMAPDNPRLRSQWCPEVQEIQ
jgi:tetratricopeptide (TPR) repeat protein